MSEIETVSVALGARSYDVVIGSGALKRAAPRVREICGRRAVVVTDSTVAGLHLDTLTRVFEAEGVTVDPVIAPPGEAQKSFTGLESLIDALVHAGVERGDTIVAFGGGVISKIGRPTQDSLFGRMLMPICFKKGVGGIDALQPVFAHRRRVVGIAGEEVGDDQLRAFHYRRDAGLAVHPPE